MSHNTPHKQKSLMNIAVINEPTYDSKITDDFILVKAKTDVAINLPAGVIGKKITIKHGNTELEGNVSIKPFSGQMIETMPQYDISLPLESITLVFLDTNWYIV